MEWIQTIVIIASIGGLMIALDKRNRSETNNRFNDMNKRIDDLRDDMNKRFNTLEKPIGEIRQDIRLIFNKIIPNRKK